MDNNQFYARFRENPDGTQEPQLLIDHLRGVAERAKAFAEAFSSGEIAFLAGMLHDFGKYSNAFQRKLRGEDNGARHSGIGAVLAQEKGGITDYLKYAIAGHHGKLSSREKLKSRLNEEAAGLDECLRNAGDIGVPEELSPPGFLRGKPRRRTEKDIAKRRKEFWIRFLFSALVDADRLDAEQHGTPEAARIREQYASIPELREMIDTGIDDFVDGIDENLRQTTVNQSRARILHSCREAAAEQPGFFSLTVPTGGGKTLSAMSFALRHAETHGMDRVIVVIPYTSIIEQNAGEYQEKLGADNVLEHHANLDPEEDINQNGEEIARKHLLAAENWDAPVIVTTTVQFFESLFSHRASRCRKVHNIARSVIILDEVQTLPPKYLITIVDGLNELVENYGCTVVLSTATPPALSAEKGFEDGLKDVREIVPDPNQLLHDLERVEYEWRTDEAAWEDLADELAQDDLRQVLTVVNKRNDARELALLLCERVDKDEVIHLSARMCPAHRKEVIKEIRRRLANDEPCRVISTQLVEAGVDVDFPTVFRAMAGLDSIVQAAGRCNREGRREKGRVVVFRAPSRIPSGTLKQALEATEQILTSSEGNPNLRDSENFTKYFRKFYHTNVHDSKGIQAERTQYHFEEIGKAFKLIDDEHTCSVIVPYGDTVEKLVTIVRDYVQDRDGSQEQYEAYRKALRRLQQYTVTVYKNEFDGMWEIGMLEELYEGVYVVGDAYKKDAYNDVFGLKTDDINPGLMES